MINTAPDDAETMQELEVDEATEGEECEEAKRMWIKRARQGEIIEIISDEE